LFILDGEQHCLSVGIGHLGPDPITAFTAKRRSHIEILCVLCASSVGSVFKNTIQSSLNMEIA